MGQRPKTSTITLQGKVLTLGKTALLSGILIAVFAFSAILGMRFAVRGRVIDTPAVTGMAMEDAEKIFSGIELTMQVVGKRYDPIIPAGAIISQLPGPGVGIKSGRQVRVITSLGRRVYQIPKLEGNSMRAARLLIEQAGFQLGQVAELSVQSDAEEAQVLAQYPHPNADEAVNDRIDVLLKKNWRAAYIMPEFVGRNMNQVLSFLKDQGFESRIFYRRHEGVRRGLVVRQFPEPGYMLREAETINLEVAR